MVCSLFLWHICNTIVLYFSCKFIYFCSCFVPILLSLKFINFNFAITWYYFLESEPRTRPDTDPTRSPNPESTESRDPKTEQLFGMWRSSRKEAKKNPQPVKAGGFTRTIYRVISSDVLTCNHLRKEHGLSHRLLWIPYPFHNHARQLNLNIY